MTGPTGFYDKHGRPIHYGDLLRYVHFREARRRRLRYLYHVVICVDGFPCVRSPHATTGWQCSLAASPASEAEIIYDNGSEAPLGWYERPKRKGGDA